jgi:hypothetical protein
VLSDKNPLYNRGSTNNSIEKRVVYKMPTMTASIITNKMALLFVGKCLSASEAYTSAPASLPMVLYSQFPKSVNRTTAGVKYHVGCGGTEGLEPMREVLRRLRAIQS